MHRIIIGLVLLVLLAIIGWEIAGRNPEPAPNPEEISLNVSNKYMSLIDWPPKLQVIEESFACTTAGGVNDRAGRSERRIINGRTYCVTQIDEGAAGSLYRQYAYATGVEDKTYILTFSTRSSQCLNYANEVEQKECLDEQQSFNPDPVIDKLMRLKIGEEKAIENSFQKKGVLIQTAPNTLFQGDPVLITLQGVNMADIESLKLNNKTLGVFEHEGKVRALVGIDLRGEYGTMPLILNLRNGTTATTTLAVGERYIAKAPLGIPDKLGGNTQEAEQALINTLIEEGKLISAVPSAGEKLWKENFRFPVDPPLTITDVYGYSRQTGGSSISHKGTDFRAAVGTPIYAMNSGVVRFTRELRNYGKTIILDHGLGLQTVYMHLSEIGVQNGQKVNKGDMIGKSGDTGYVLGPHLHLTIRINGTSIDPEKFMEILGE